MSPLVILLIFSVCLAAIVVELGYAVFSPADAARKRINRRMGASENKKTNQKDILIQLRKERGLDSEGKLLLPLIWLNRLIVQAGITIGIKKLAICYVLYLAFSTLIILFLTFTPIYCVLALPFTAVGIPLFLLRRRRNKKLDAFGLQLPEAIDLITRGLKAGHPVPVAVNMVAREMADPIGTEFGMVCDEVTYGSDLVTALNNLYDRVGNTELPLLIASVSIQATTGGNLREILEGLSSVIRDRMKMNRKVRAISAEGRISAMILSGLPVLLLGALKLFAPDYYVGIWNEELTYWLVGILLIWLGIGNAMILKMVNLKF